MSHYLLWVGGLSDQLDVSEVDANSVQRISYGNIINVVLVLVMVEGIPFFFGILKDLLHLR